VGLRTALQRPLGALSSVRARHRRGRRSAPAAGQEL